MGRFSYPEDTYYQLVVKCAAEFVGTFILVHVICLAVNTFVVPPITIGICLAALVYQLGHVSGAHFNPAVSTAVWIGGGIEAVTLMLYICSQVAGAALSGTIASMVTDEKNGGFPSISVGENKIGLWTEFFFTFLLASTVLNVAVSKTPGYQGNSFFGLAIGFALLVGASAGGKFSGGAYNPAVVIGVNLGNSLVYGKSMMMGHGGLPSAGNWISVIVMDLLGGLTAGCWFLFTESAEKDEQTETMKEPPVIMTVRQ